jgi:hypothetical protein
MSFLTTFSDEASKTYKDAARTATTGPINLLSAPASIGSVSLNLNDRVLVKDQANAEENGIYVFKGAGSPMVRSTDANSDREVLPNMLISVSEGDYEDKIFELTTNGPISLGVTPLSFGLAILPIDLTTDVVGVLPVANGGTNRASWTEGRVVFAGASGSALTEDSDLNWDNSNKRLGIGLLNPAYPLHVDGDGAYNGNLSIGGVGPTGSGPRLGIIKTDNSTNALTSAPFIELDNGSLIANTNAFINFRGTVNGSNSVYCRIGSIFQSGLNGAFVVQNFTNGSLSEKMRVTSAGNVGIGTATPAFLLTVNGTTRTSNVLADNGSLSVPAYAFANNSNMGMYYDPSQGLAFSTSGIRRLQIQNSNGNVGIGLTFSASEKLHVAGNVKAEGLLLQSRHNLTGAVTVLSNDYYVGCNSSGGAVTVALQSAATAKQGRKLVIKAESSLANVTINAAAGETIDGSASHVLNVSYESVTLVCNGANAWFIV